MEPLATTIPPTLFVPGDRVRVAPWVEPGFERWHVARGAGTVQSIRYGAHKRSDAQWWAYVCWDWPDPHYMVASHCYRVQRCTERTQRNLVPEFWQPGDMQASVDDMHVDLRRDIMEPNPYAAYDLVRLKPVDGAPFQPGDQVRYVGDAPSHVGHYTGNTTIGRVVLCRTGRDARNWNAWRCKVDWHDVDAKLSPGRYGRYGQTKTAEYFSHNLELVRRRVDFATGWPVDEPAPAPRVERSEDV